MMLGTLPTHLDESALPCYVLHVRDAVAPPACQGLDHVDPIPRRLVLALRVVVGDRLHDLARREQLEVFECQRLVQCGAQCLDDSCHVRVVDDATRGLLEVDHDEVANRSGIQIGNIHLDDIEWPHVLGAKTVVPVLDPRLDGACEQVVLKQMRQFLSRRHEEAQQLEVTLDQVIQPAVEPPELRVDDQIIDGGLQYISGGCDHRTPL